MMKLRMLAGVLVAVVALPLVSVAQDAGGTRQTQLQMELKRKRTVVHPAPPREAVDQDLQRAEAMLAEERRERLVRELTKVQARRPDLDYVVTSGIQARNLQRLRR